MNKLKDNFFAYLLLLTFMLIFFSAGWIAHPDTKEEATPSLHFAIATSSQEKVISVLAEKKINGDCGLVNPPCWYDFGRTLVKVK